METATINFRVADFLKKHPPFQAMEEKDLLDLAGRGRVKFFERNEYIVLQGEPYRHYIFIIQQGTITLWDESGKIVELRDVLGAGDFLGIEQFNDGRSYAYSARSSSDVVLYTFPAFDFEALVLKYPYARQYVAAHSYVAVDYQLLEEQRDVQNTFLHDLVKGRQLPVCDASSSIADVAGYLLTTGAEAVAVMDRNQVRAILTANSLLEWIASGGGDARDPIAALVHGDLITVPSDTSVTDGVLAMATSDTGALAITQDGTAHGNLNAIVTPQDLGPVFGDQPVAILRDIRLAPTVRALQELNERARAFVFRYLTSGASVGWLARFTSLADSAILQRIITLTVPEDLPACWCFCGASGRGESLTKVAPQLLLILDDNENQSLSSDVYRRVVEASAACGYLHVVDMPFEPPFYAATATEWKQRYRNWLRDPILQEMYKARPLFDLKPVHGRQQLWQTIVTSVGEAMDRDFLYVLANDCLSSLPPLTFFQDAVVDDSGEQSAIFRLEQSALRPLVDVGRVFGMAGKSVLGTSTLERFAIARRLMPEQASIFAEASDTLRVVLWQQGRIGIRQNTAGAELPPALLSRYDRQVLKSGFRSILRLFEFMADPQWLKTL